MSCEDSVSEILYDYFLTSSLQIISWDPPGGKKYFTKGLRIPLFENGTRVGREIPDLIIVSDSLIILTECKCTLNECSGDVKKLESIQELGVTRLIELFRNQGASITNSKKRLLLSLGVSEVNSDIPPNFIVFVANKITKKVTVVFGSNVDTKIKEAISNLL